jgi:hypothetical protein
MMATIARLRRVAYTQSCGSLCRAGASSLTQNCRFYQGAVVVR